MASLVVTLLTAAVIGALTYTAYTAFVNLYLHPLAKFPGPKLAAATSLWRVRQPLSAENPIRYTMPD